MKDSTVDKAMSIGVGINVAVGHVGEMAGRAAQATGCPVVSSIGKATERAGKAWADTAVTVGRRDASRLKGK